MFCSKQEFHVTCEATVNKTVLSTGTNSASRDDLYYKKTTDMKSMYSLPIYSYTYAGLLVSVDKDL